MATAGTRSDAAQTLPRWPLFELWDASTPSNLSTMSGLSAVRSESALAPCLQDRYWIAGDLWRCEGDGIVVFLACDVEGA